NSKGELKAITTQSGRVLDGPTVPTPPPFINPEEDERLHININLADALILMPKYQKMLKALLSNMEKLQELTNTPLNKNCSTVILKKLPKKLGDPGKFFIPCGFSELKCKALADLGASINLIPLTGKDSSLKDSSIQTDLTNLDDYFVDPIPEIFIEEYAPDYSSPLKFDVYLNDFLGNESYADNFYDDPFDSEGEKIKEVDDLPSPDNEDKVFNPGILFHEKSVTIITRVAQENKLAISYASLVFKDFEPPFCAPLFFKDVPKSRMLLLFSTENKEKVFKPGIHTSGKDYPDCEVFRALSFSFTRASHPQFHFGNPASKSYRFIFSYLINGLRFRSHPSKHRGRCLVLVWGVSSI
nr:reverse transcriptase domain-containing protein [Tanacetum cinerariifolium]